MNDALALELVEIMGMMNDSIKNCNDSIKGLTEITRVHQEWIERLHTRINEDRP